MEKIKNQLSETIKGQVTDEHGKLNKYSHDASLFEVIPSLIVTPEDVEDIKQMVKLVAKHKQEHDDLSITVRSGGTDMSGGAINDSIILDMKNLAEIGEVKDEHITTQPGAYYKDFEKITKKHGLIMPAYPASRNICTVGGIAANNSGGEKSLIYGKTKDYVTSLKMVLRDGEEYKFTSISKEELEDKSSHDTVEGEIYRELSKMLQEESEIIKDAEPPVSKNSSGYNLWDVWDGQTFDIPKLLVGSQGTLGIITEITFKLVPVKPLSGMVIMFLPDTKQLGPIINASLKYHPSSLESFDEHTLKFAFRFFFSFHKTMGWKKFISLGFSFIPVLGTLAKHLHHLPKFIMLAEFEGESQEEIDTKTSQLKELMNEYNVDIRVAPDKKHEEKYWIMRRESFNLLRKHVKDKHTAPFIDDLVVPPEYLPEFLPRLDEILERSDLLYTVAGHMGDGNFHIIPLMDLSDPEEREKIPKILDEVIELILEYNGSLSGEHNDGLVRGPYLEAMFGEAVSKLFQRTKNIFDPEGIFNPHKKTDAELDYSMNHIRQSF